MISCINEGLAITDEMLYGYIVGKNPDLFEPHVADYCGVLANLSYQNRQIHLGIYFFNTSYKLGTHYYTHKIAESLRMGYFNGKLSAITTHELYSIWYYNYVACFWLGKKDKCVEILNELYSLVIENIILKYEIDGIYGFFREMISHLGNDEINQKFDSLFLSA
jgi:hypothetical protein